MTTTGNNTASAAKPNGTAPPEDALDIASLWINTGVGDPLTEEHFLTIPVGKPKDFFRVHPGLDYRQRVEILVLKPENAIGDQFYVIAPTMRGRIDEARPCILTCVVDRAGFPRLWPLITPR